jgi:hypothetical protein
MSKFAQKLDEIEDLTFKHMMLDTMIKEYKYDSQDATDLKIRKLAVKERIEELRKEVGAGLLQEGC